MEKLWSVIASFNVLYILNLWFMDRTNHSLIDVFNPSQNWSSVPIFGLSLGALIIIFSNGLMLRLVSLRHNDSWTERIPELWIEETNDASFRKIWKGSILVVTVIFPILAQIHFWLRFHQWNAWTNYASSRGMPVSLYEPVSPIYLLCWDAHRYGDFSKMTQDGWHGVSYVPLWQPIIMGILTACCLLSVVLIFRRVFQINMRPVG